MSYLKIPGYPPLECGTSLEDWEVLGLSKYDMDHMAFLFALPALIALCILVLRLRCIDSYYQRICRVLSPRKLARQERSRRPPTLPEDAKYIYQYLRGSLSHAGATKKSLTAYKAAEVHFPLLSIRPRAETCPCNDSG
jgi:hypothetical protein